MSTQDLDKLKKYEFFKNKNKILELQNLELREEEIVKELKLPENNLKEKLNETEKIILNKMIDLNKEENIDNTLTDIKLFYTHTNHPSASSGTNLQHLKMISINEYLSAYEFPFVLDNFRNHELSSEPEQKYLDYFTSIDRQVILSASWKTEERECREDITYVFLETESLLTDKDYIKGNTLYIEKYSNFR